MRMSCNGCRVLRKACSDDCVIRSCLDWIRTPEAQGNATLFLAKFYGRAGLSNLLSGGPQHLRAAIYRSLLYEACGRIVNPVYGAVGLLWSGKWQLCQAAVEAVLKGAPIQAADIRHVATVRNPNSINHNKINIKSHAHFKRSGFWSVRTQTGKPSPLEGVNVREGSMETACGSNSSEGEKTVMMKGEVGLELTLGPRSIDEEERLSLDESQSDTCYVKLGLTIPV
ncbi:hypothetical protein LUZ60_012728 [Juncus effusus]|nr:hypothetical protein LUZ60_012728 [Juncus effusus]